ncbi:MAG: AAA family ATPase [Gammaproteobacteria bacterium]|nr:AAA family ATPase [Gammaproteobacteria bacterium]
MERSLEQHVADPTYLEFFGLTQPPFARLSDPCQLFQSEQYSLLMEHLANAATNTDSLVVICGADGSGKSTLLNRFITTNADNVSCVVIDETCRGEEQFYSAFLTQIGFEEISGTAGELRNITKEFLVCRGIANDHVLIIIDNAHLTDPMILEQLRWLCEIKIKDRRVLSVVLGGNADIVRVVDAPAMRQTKFRSHVVFSIRNYSEEETANYVWHRLRLAGGDHRVKLPNEAVSLIHRYSGGIPHLINRLCNDMLAEAYGLKSRVITEKIVRTVADKQQLLPHVIPLHGKGRRRSDPDFKHVQAAPETARADPEILLQQIAQLSEQLDDLRADKARALQDIDVRHNDIIVLRDELDSQSIEVAELKRSLAIDADEIAQQNLALSNSATALQDSEIRSKKLAADLDKEIRARKAAQNELAEATAKVGELGLLRQELQATVDDVQADLKVADERAVEIEALEKHTADLKEEIEGRTGELDSLRDELNSRNEALAEFEMRLEESQAECESAQQRITALKNPEELEKIEKASDKLAADLRKETRARKAAQKELAKATATVEELNQLKQELQATADDVQADLEVGLKVADEQAVEIEALEKSTVDLKDEIEGKTGELDSQRDELKSLRERLASRDQDVADLERWLEESQKERASAQLRIIALKNPEELEEVEKASGKLAAKLEQEIRAREAAQNELAKATATVEELSQLERELQASVRDLNADLRVAGERAVEVYVLERNVTDLKEELEKRTRELDSRNQTLADLEKRFEASQNECELLRRRTSAANIDEDIVSEEAVTASARDARVYSSHVVAKFEQSLSNVSAYQTLREYDPAFYDGLIITYKQLVGQDLTDKQVNDALRAKQAELMERLLPGASDDAIIAYARLIVDQLDELRLDHTEPCLTLLIPQSSPDSDTSPIYSEITKGRELDTLEITLRTYDVDRQLPAEEDVWPDLEPIFAELFEEFGADNVAAMENSYDPSVDRLLVCNVSRALYSGILDLPKRNAANALRWLLSSE